VKKSTKKTVKRLSRTLDVIPRPNQTIRSGASVMRGREFSATMIGSKTAATLRQ
jgi:hypothetical protein